MLLFIHWWWPILRYSDVFWHWWWYTGIYSDCWWPKKTTITISFEHRPVLFSVALFPFSSCYGEIPIVCSFSCDDGGWVCIPGVLFIPIWYSAVPFWWSDAVSGILEWLSICIYSMTFDAEYHYWFDAIVHWYIHSRRLTLLFYYSVGDCYSLRNSVLFWKFNVSV